MLANENVSNVKVAVIYHPYLCTHPTPGIRSL